VLQALPCRDVEFEFRELKGSFSLAGGKLEAAMALGGKGSCRILQCQTPAHLACFAMVSVAQQARSGLSWILAHKHAFI